jgi:hypothetical protein
VGNDSRNQLSAISIQPSGKAERIVSAVSVDAAQVLAENFKAMKIANIRTMTHSRKKNLGKVFLTAEG